MGLDWGQPRRGHSPDPRRQAREGTATPAEVRKLIMLAAAPKAAGGMEDMVLAAFILVAAVTGCRRGELCGLKWGDLDPDTLSLRVERQLVPAKGGQHEAPPKSKGGTRTVFLDREVFDFLDGYRTEQRVLLERNHKGGCCPMTLVPPRCEPRRSVNPSLGWQGRRTWLASRRTASAA